ncbi:MAG: aminotransferase class I/II-fold pyridoxal phosphate-dependent enzyme [Candidatus Aenigmarchaeota archaeon]|nr:aminotransferase class I/II-fold pyridoxal phosphate-dependent enzyme [Candidatus Aenigmarchaeota archaeon]
MKHISEREEELPYGVIHKLLKIAVEDKSIISLGPGEPDFPAPPEIIEHTKKIADQVNHYSPPAGRHELKEALVKKVRKENKIKADFDMVLPTTGSQEGLMLAMMCTIDATEQIIIPNPGFFGYVSTAELVDAVPMPLQLKEENKFEPDPDDIKKVITGKTSAILLNTPANPTGNVISKKILEEIADIAIDKDLYVFSDEAYEHIIYDNAKHVSIGSLNGMHDYVVSLFTFSKSFAMCGYRIGYAVGPKDLIEAMAKSHTYTTIATPTISQFLALRALEMKRTYTNMMVKEYKRRRNMLVKRLNDMGFPTHMPQGAFYAFSNIQRFDKDSKRFAATLLEKAKVAVVPGIEFGIYGEGFIRVSFATKYELIEKALDRIEKFLQKY